MNIGSYSFDPDRPALMGILNVTPDSFSDGGCFASADAAIRHALNMVEDGADLIDVGGESTRPGAEGVPLEEELRRVVPVIEGIRRRSDAAISIDTMKGAVAEAAMDAGADMINDVSAGMFDPGILSVAARTGAPICLMHMQGEPRTMQVAPHYDDLMGEIRSFLSDAIVRSVAAGVHRDKIIVDPGIGFGKGAEENLRILKEMTSLKSLEVPILIGTSRKSFIGKLLGLTVDKRLEATLATLAVAIDGGASVLRVHDVAPARKFLDMYVMCRRI